MTQLKHDSSVPPFSAWVEGRVWVVIPAAGMGLRMGGGGSGESLPKQFLELAGRPVLARTLDAFETLEPISGVVVVLPPQGFERWREMVEAYGLGRVDRIVPGGRHRFESVAAGLDACPDDTGVVVIHDGARPLVTGDIIMRSIDVAKSGRGAVTAVRAQDTVKLLDGGRLRSLDREAVFMIQTPQTFPYRDLVRAYELLVDSGPSFTDDARLFESLDWPLEIVEGHPENVKLTTQTDLRLAEAILRSRDENRSRL